METLYRKVAVSDRLPKINGNYFTDKNRSFYFNQEVNKFMDDEGDFVYPKHWLEEIPDNSLQIEKLEADKAELLHFMKFFIQSVEDEDFIMVNNTDEDIVDNLLSKFNSLIQKHKQ